MSKTKPAPYDANGFEGAHQARGLSEKARERLASKGLIAKTPQKAERTTAPRRKASSGDRPVKGSSEAGTGPVKGPSETAAGLPRRSRKARSLRARHFRLPIEIDDKLQDLTETYDSTMVWVICKLIHEDWVRTRRAMRRSTSEDQPSEGQPAAPGDPPDLSSTPTKG